MFNVLNRISLRILNVFYRWELTAGPNTIFLGRIRYYNPKNITIGSNCSINPGVFLNVSSKLLIGSNVTISANAFITTVGLDLSHYPAKVHFSRDVIIEDDVWIGAGSVVMPGVTLRRGSIIGAGSIVTRSTDEFCVYAGNPAKKIRRVRG